MLQLESNGCLSGSLFSVDRGLGQVACQEYGGLSMHQISHFNSPLVRGQNIKGFAEIVHFNVPELPPCFPTFIFSKKSVLNFLYPKKKCSASILDCAMATSAAYEWES